MKKYTITQIFGLIGVLFWSGTVLLREMQLQDSGVFKYVLGVMPNIAAYWVCICIGEILMNKAKRDFTFMAASIVSGVIFFLALISEIIHDRFLNSPFDMNDIAATILAILIYLIAFCVSKQKAVRTSGMDGRKNEVS